MTTVSRKILSSTTVDSTTLIIILKKFPEQQICTLEGFLKDHVTLGFLKDHVTLGFLKDHVTGVTMLKIQL